MGMSGGNFLEVIEWFDDTGKELAHRIPEEGSGDIKYGAQLTVRESQAAVFFYEGKAYDAVGAGRYTLSTLNIPIITKILSLPWGFVSPLRAEVYFINTKTFANLTWGTRDPVAFKDSTLGLIRLRAFGMFNIRVVQPSLFINTLVGTKGSLYRRGHRRLSRKGHSFPFQRLPRGQPRYPFQPAGTVRYHFSGAYKGAGKRFLSFRHPAFRPLYQFDNPSTGSSEGHR